MALVPGPWLATKLRSSIQPSSRREWTSSESASNLHRLDIYYGLARSKILLLCGKKSSWQNKASLNVNRLLFQILVGELQYLTDHLLLLNISLYDPSLPKRVFQGNTVAEPHLCFVGIFLLGMPHLNNKNSFFVDLQNKCMKKGLMSTIYDLT